MEKDIGKIKKNETTDIVIRIDDFGGRPGVTIREYVRGERYTGFTKSGTKIPAESFSAFREIINSISEEDLKVEEEQTETVKELENQETLEKSESAEEETLEEIEG